MSFIPASHHKSRGIDSTPRGPARWERAARNALLRPHSKAAQIYRERYDVALVISQAATMLESKDRPWQFMGRRAYGIGKKNEYGYYPEYEHRRARVYACCSTFCTIMQATLDLQTTDGAKISAAFTKEVPANSYAVSIEPLDKSTLRKAGMKCKVCGTQIKK